ncbi:Cu(I)/Ag(I) efflux system protein CusF [Collimonas sp. PA-H2]|uniref:copper-binding protein n=1 Tax=Collimonas sp. PA-H2 TaxID=1881062 RepID=UPI000BF543DC|nr:copper-binding protein [Collimonas sp. PA-H2]PFH07775.1 Cu(I)/Ag(I) efflux system protein CusF [Collimonas sp. PA-H2]
MKPTAALSLILALSASGAAFAQSGGAKTTEMKGMDMKAMPMDNMNSGSTAKTATHQATGVVKAVDTVKGTVTLAHGPVKTLNWPAMTMTFTVKDKMFFDKLAADKKVTIDFVKQGADYVVTSVK